MSGGQRILSKNIGPCAWNPNPNPNPNSNPNPNLNLNLTASTPTEQQDKTRRHETRQVKRKGKVEGDTGHKVFFVLSCHGEIKHTKIESTRAKYFKKTNFQLQTLTLASALTLTLLIVLCYPQDSENGGAQMRITVLFVPSFLLTLWNKWWSLPLLYESAVFIFLTVFGVAIGVGGCVVLPATFESRHLTTLWNMTSWSLSQNKK